MSTGSPRQLWLLPVLLIVVIATALGGLFARDLYAPAAPATPAAVEPSPLPSAAPLAEQPGSPEVRATADATTHPLYGVLQPVLQGYFDAINTKDYGRWAETVTSRRRSDMPENVWREDYGTTRNGSIVMYRIEAVGHGSARVMLRFTSTQDRDQAPPEIREECINWNVVYAFSRENGQWRLAAGATSKTPVHVKCPGT